MTALTTSAPREMNKPQTPDNNAILRYHEKIQCGEIIVGEKVRTVYEHLAKKVFSPEDEYIYNADRALHIIEFYERYLRHSKGALAGKRVRLELWQKAFFSAAFGFTDINGIRQYRRIILIVGKKNGKSFMASGVGLYGLTADGEGGPEIYSVATKRDQAKIIWEESKRMRNKSPALRRRIRATVAGLFYDDVDGLYKPLGSNVDTLDGLNISVALMDEFQQWKHGRALYDIIADGTSAREQPIIMMTSTAGTIRDDIYDEIYEEGTLILDGYKDPNGAKDIHTLPIIYEIDKKEEWDKPDMWVKANPNLGVSKSLEYLEDKVQKAKQDQKLIKNLICKEFNVRETAQSALFSWEELNNETTFEFKQDCFLVHTQKNGKKITEKLKRPDYGVAGFDLSVRGDLTAAVVNFAFPEDDRLFTMPMFWMPEDTVEKHLKSDRVPYDKWIEKGFVRVSPGNQINYKLITKWFLEVKEGLDIYLPWIGYDPAYAAYLEDELKQIFGQSAMQPVRQGFITLGMPMATIIKKYKAHQVIYNNNPVFKFNLRCVSVEEDRNGNLMPSKRQKGNMRIDGFAAQLDAWTVMQNKHDEYQALIEN